MWCRAEYRTYKHLGGVIKADTKEVLIEEVTKIDVDNNTVFIDYRTADGLKTLYLRKDELLKLNVCQR